MKNYVILTDSGCDISPEILNKWNVGYRSLTFMFDNDDTIYSNYDLTPDEFYSRMKAGETAKTSAINVAEFEDWFRGELEKGNDIVYLGFSSGLSGTFNYACAAARDLREEFPDRKIFTVDTLSASAGLGLVVYLTAKKRDEGASVSEAVAYAESISPKLCHWFTVDDLVYLKRGGRVSSTAALIGGVLNIKPVLHVDDEGHLINMSKVRGRNASIKALADKYGSLAETPNDGTVFICQADCSSDAEKLADMIFSAYGVNVELITDIGPVIGSHAGPGTIAVFFIGKER